MRSTRRNEHQHLVRSRRWLREKDRLALAIEQRLPNLVFDRNPELGARLGGSVPVTGAGTWRGHRFHFRFRYDIASLAVFINGTEWVATCYEVTGEQYAGSLGEIPDLPQLLARLIVDLAPADAQSNRTPYQRLAANLDVLLGRIADPIAS